MRPLFSGERPSSNVLVLFEKSCRDCHSDATVWPWYSRFPPVSWLIENDVREARATMNLSRWDEYSAAEREAYLSFIAVAVRTKAMPPARYLRLHPDARLSSDDIGIIRQWTGEQRRRLREQPPQSE